MKKTMQNVKEKLKKKKQKNVVKIVIKWLSEKEKGILNVNKKLKKERVLLQILMVLEISLRNLQLLLLV
jgi:DNA-directed RNA polymerase specialized sigma subunit